MLQELPGGMILITRRRLYATQFSGFLIERPDSDEPLPGDTSQMGSILMFLGVLGYSDRRG